MSGKAGEPHEDSQLDGGILKLFVDRPVSTLVLSLLLVLFGLVTMTYLPVKETPNVTAPTVTVRTTYVGADPSVVEADVTEVLERELNGIEGVRTLTSTSSEGSSSITVEFTLERDLEDAANDVRSRVSRARRNLPDDVEEPVVEKADADASPVLFVRLDGAGYSLLELTEYGDTLVRERLQNTPGVSSVDIFGEQKYAIRIDLDVDRLTARNLTVDDLEQALVANNVDLPAGRVEGQATELTVQLDGSLRTAEEFARLVVKTDGDTLVRLGDVADVRLGAENERTAARSDGQPTITVAVIPQSNANIIEVSDEVRARLPQIQEDLPDGISVVLNYDRTESVRSSLREVEETIFIAFGLVVLVIFAFLRDFRSTLIPALAIPVSLIGTFLFLYVAGFSINIFTLFGLVLAIGLVVDDAIVVLENVYRRIELGENVRDASIRGTRRIAFAVIATTASLVAVFLPIVFAGGTTGRLFLEFGATVAVSVVISGFVALTLTPMLCRLLLKPQVAKTGSEEHGLLARWFAKSLSPLIRFPVLALVPMVGAAALAAVAWRYVPQEFFPIEDRNIFFVRVQGAEGNSFEYTDARMKELETELMAAVPERISLLSRVASGPGGTVAAANSGQYVFPLVPYAERERSQQEIVTAVRAQVASVTAFMTIPIQFPTVGRGFGAPLQFVLQNPDYEALTAELPAFIERMKKIPGLSAINPDLKLNKPELGLDIDREKTASTGVTVRSLARSLQVLAGGRELTKFKRKNREYPVIAQLGRTGRDSPEDLLRIPVRTRSGALSPLGTFAAPREGSAASSRFHYDRSPSATISANLDGITLGEGLARVQAMADETLPEGFRTALAGESKEFKEANAALGAIFALALAVVFLVLAAQFNSFVDPFPILVGVPLALAGALTSLWIMGMTLSFFSQVGMILLIGLVTKNGILVVEVARQLQEEDPDLDVWDAAREAATLRFRPILMTSVATIGGALPIAIGWGAPSRAPLGVVVVGGMIVSTTLTLYITPVAWAVFARIFRGRKRGITPASLATAAVAAGSLLLVPLPSEGAPLGLAETLATAIERHPDLKQARLREEAAAAAVGVARGSYLPFATATADWQTGNDPRLRLGVADPTNEVLSASARVTVQIVDIPAIARIAAARKRLTAAERDQESVALRALSEAATAFVTLQAAEGSREAVGADKARSARLLELARARQEAGAVASIEVTRAEVSLKQDELREILATTAVDNARIELRRVLLLDQDDPIENTERTPLVDPRLIPEEPKMDELLRELAQNHPDLVASRANLQALWADRDALRFQSLPSLDLYGQVGALGPLTRSQSMISTQIVGINTTIPFFLGTQRLFDAKRLKALAEAQEVAIADAQATLEASLRRGYQNLRDAVKGMELAQAIVGLAQSEVQLAEERFSAGESDNVALVQAQARLAETRQGEVAALGNYNLAVVRWWEAQGRLAELAASP